ncbi:MAG: DNA topoisomerase IV [Robiginitalea sp.]
MRAFLLFIFIATISACSPRQRDCQRFKTGTFQFTARIDGVEETTVFRRTADLEVSQFKGKTDSVSVRWINPCEYIGTTLNPQSPGEEKPIHIKILSTTDNSYTFEYKRVGESQAIRGTAFKTD